MTQYLVPAGPVWALAQWGRRFNSALWAIRSRYCSPVSPPHASLRADGFSSQTVARRTSSSSR